MVASRDSNSIGLTSNSSQPVAIACSRSLSSAYADMPMIGMSRVWGSVLRVRTGSQRSTTGISRSIRITSGCSVAANFQPFSVLSAARTSKSPTPLKAHLEHVEVVVIVFDVEHFGHIAVSVFLLPPGYLVTRSPRRQEQVAYPGIRQRNISAPGVSTLFGSNFFFASEIRRHMSGPKWIAHSSGDITPA